MNALSDDLGVKQGKERLPRARQTETARIMEGAGRPGAAANLHGRLDRSFAVLPCCCSCCCPACRPALNLVRLCLTEETSRDPTTSLVQTKAFHSPFATTFTHCCLSPPSERIADPYTYTPSAPSFRSHHTPWLTKQPSWPSWPLQLSQQPTQRLAAPPSTARMAGEQS